MASRKLILDKANELFEDVKRAVGPTEFRRFLLILREVNRDGYEAVNVRQAITKVRDVIGRREDLMLRFTELVYADRQVSEESGSPLGDVRGESDGVRADPNFGDDVDETARRRQQSTAIPPRRKGEERVRRTLNFDDVPGYIEKGKMQQRLQSDALPHSRSEGRCSVRRTLNFDVPENMEKGKIQQRQQSDVPSYSRSEGRPFVKRTLNFDVPEYLEKGKMQHRQQSEVPSCSRSEGLGNVRRRLNFDMHENKEKGSIQPRQHLPDFSLDCRGDESRVGSIVDGDEKREAMKMTQRQQSDNPPDSSTDKKEGVVQVRNLTGALLKENLKRCQKSVIEATTPHRKDKSDRESKVRKLDENAEHVAKVLELNREVLDILAEVLKIVDRRNPCNPNGGSDSSEISAIFRLINGVLDNVYKVYTDKKHTVKDLIDIGAEVLRVIEKVIGIAEEGLSDGTLMENDPEEGTPEVLTEEGFSNSFASKENDSGSVSGEVSQLLEEVTQIVERIVLIDRKLSKSNLL